MFTRLLKYLAGADSERVEALTLEEAAICAAWYDSHILEPAALDSFKAVPEKLEHWKAHFSIPTSITEGRRQQPLLRQVIRQSQRRRSERLHRSELDFLAAVAKLISELAIGSAPFSRVESLLAGKTIEFEDLRATQEQAPGLAGLENSVVYLSSDDIKEAATRAVKTFAGVDMPGRGPVFTQKGNTKVLDHVPDDHMLVVEDGSCWVGGYVLGWVAASQNCEVRENIAGVAIVREGDIRCRSVINNAFVVSKRGRTIARAAENPKMIFGGMEIRIGENATSGTYGSPVITIGNEVLGGDFTASESLSAKAFQASDQRKLTIVLPWKIRQDFYGEAVNPEAQRLVSVVRKREQRLANLNNLAELTSAECEHFALAAIMFMFGGDKLRKQVEEMNDLQRRLVFLNRVIAGIDALSVSAEEQLMEAARAKGKRSARAADSIDSALKELREELLEMAPEDTKNADLGTEREELLSMTGELDKGGIRTTLPVGSIERLRVKKVNWLMERKTIFERLELKELALRKLLGNAGNFDSDGDAPTAKVDILGRLVATARRRPAGDPLTDRLSATFMRLMLRTIDSRKQRLVNYREMSARLKDDIRRDSEKLQYEYNVSIEEPGNNYESPPEVKGSFGAGVRIVSERFYLAEGGEAGRNMIVTQNSGSTQKRYFREKTGIAEE